MPPTYALVFLYRFKKWSISAISSGSSYCVVANICCVLAEDQALLYALLCISSSTPHNNPPGRFCHYPPPRPRASRCQGSDLNPGLLAPESALLNFIPDLFKYTSPKTVHILSICSTCSYFLVYFLPSFFLVHTTLH